MNSREVLMETENSILLLADSSNLARDPLFATGVLILLACIAYKVVQSNKK